MRACIEGNAEGIKRIMGVCECDENSIFKFDSGLGR